MVLHQKPETWLTIASNTLVDAGAAKDRELRTSRNPDSDPSLGKRPK